LWETIRRTFPLLALVITFALTAAQPTLALTSIKVVDKDRANKDQWSVKGYLKDPGGKLDESGRTAVL